jgi:D-glycero-alpha-D-manno-heptose 1-phosphate guanylyltransferase
MDLAHTPAAILAGGRGTRLRSVVADRPKVLAPVGGRPFVAYLLDQLAAAGLRDVLLLTGYRAEQVRETLGDGYAGLRLRYSVETTPLGTGGAVRQALAMVDGPRLLVLNGDSCCDLDLADFAAEHERRRAETSLALVHTADTARFGRVRLDDSGHITQFEEKQTAGDPGWINAGAYFLERNVIADISAASLERDVFPRLAAQRRLWGHCTAGELLDIGTPESYARAEAFFANRERSVLCPQG